MAEAKAADRPRRGPDKIIAAVAIANECVEVADNDKDFVDLHIVNPIRGPV